MPQEDIELPRRTGQINRRNILKGLGVAGTVGVFGSGQAAARGPGGRGPPGQSCNCDDSQGVFIAKYDFVCIHSDEYDTCDEWGFVLAEGEDVVDITVTEVKDGDDDEPITVEFEADGFVVQSVCAYGGRDTDTTEDEDGVTKFSTDLTNPGGQQAAISNLTFCCSVGEEDPVCAKLEAEFNCVTTDGGEPTGHRIDVHNLNTGGTDFGLAILNSPDEFVGVDGRFIEGEESKTVPGRDASFPLAGIVFWEDDDACEDFKGLTRAKDWEGIETPIGIPDPDDFDWSSVSASRKRYDEVVSIESIEEFNAALNPGVGTGDEEVPANVYVAEIDYSSLNPVKDWGEERDQFVCSG